MNNNRQTDNDPVLTTLIVLIIGVIFLFFDYKLNDEPYKCKKSDCNNKAENGSSYCRIHDPDKHSSYIYTTRATTSKVTTRATASTTAKSSGGYRTTTRKVTPSTTTAPDDDPFNARDYVDPDDFYDDYYDEFYDYEDAEEYWEDRNWY